VIISGDFKMAYKTIAYDFGGTLAEKANLSYKLISGIKERLQENKYNGIDNVVYSLKTQSAAESAVESAGLSNLIDGIYSTGKYNSKEKDEETFKSFYNEIRDSNKILLAYIDDSKEAVKAAVNAKKELKADFDIYLVDKEGKENNEEGYQVVKSAADVIYDGNKVNSEIEADALSEANEHATAEE